MKRLLFILSFGLIVGIANVHESEAQVYVNINIDLHPAWGPSGYNYAEYYYIPEINVYYDVIHRMFYYPSRGRWIATMYLPVAYSYYDFYSLYKVVLNGVLRPWRYNRNHIRLYSHYCYNYHQVPIYFMRDPYYRVARSNYFVWVEHRHMPRNYGRPMYNDYSMNTRNGRISNPNAPRRETVTTRANTAPNNATTTSRSSAPTTSRNNATATNRSSTPATSRSNATAGSSNSNANRNNAATTSRSNTTNRNNATTTNSSSATNRSNATAGNSNSATNRNNAATTTGNSSNSANRNNATTTTGRSNSSTNSRSGTTTINNATSGSSNTRSGTSTTSGSSSNTRSSASTVNNATSRSSNSSTTTTTRSSDSNRNNSSDSSNGRR